MPSITLIDQDSYAENILPKMLLLKQQLDLRAEIWERLPIEKKRKWVTSGKDPLMNLAFQMGQYFKDNFPELLEEY